MARKTTTTTTGKEKSKNRTIAESALYLARPEQSAAGLSDYQPPKKTRAKRKAEKQEITAPEEKKHPVSKYTKFIPERDLAIILDQISDGVSLRTICALNNWEKYAVLHEINSNPEYANQYTHARERQADHYAEEIIELADNCSGTIEDTNRVKIQIDARKWACGKLHPRRYSDKAQIEVSGANGAPLTIAAASVNIEQLNALREQLNAAIDITAEELPQ